jgi:hypothetical protein
MTMTRSERHAEIAKLEFQVYPALREQYVTLENYRRVRVAELEKADADSGLTEAELQARIEFGDNFEAYLAYRTSVDRGLVNDAQFVKGRR